MLLCARVTASVTNALRKKKQLTGFFFQKKKIPIGNTVVLICLTLFTKPIIGKNDWELLVKSGSPSMPIINFLHIEEKYGILNMDNKAGMSKEKRNFYKVK